MDCNCEPSATVTFLSLVEPKALQLTTSNDAGMLSSVSPEPWKANVPIVLILAGASKVMFAYFVVAWNASLSIISRLLLKVTLVTF